jgi:DMSO/TMAO reductase YedYZ molybdopterin-dependent catalytic subunit
VPIDERAYDEQRLEQWLWRLGRQDLSRRALLRAAAAGAGAAALGFALPSLAPTAAAAATGIVKPTPPELFRLLGTNAEMLWEAMAGQGYLTGIDRFFVRNHTATPTIDAKSWRLRIEGSGVKKSVDLNYAQIVKMRRVTMTRFVECAGNGRSFFASQQGTPASGSQWRLGAVGVAEWTGVPLCDVLDRAGLLTSAVDVMPEGLDNPVGTQGHVRRPLPIEKALAEDTLLVYAMNGQLLPPDHGFPIRLLVPGWVGISSIKWVGRIEVSTEPLFSAWNTTLYRLFGDAYPDSPLVTEQAVKSAFELPFPATLPAGGQLLTGRSWSGRAGIAGVDVSVDGGASWQPATLAGQNEPQAWVQWSVPWSPVPGDYVLKARARDLAGRVQPDTVPFNTQGYLFWAVVNHPVTVV